MSAGVTALHPPVVHYPPCDRDHYGRAVMALLDLDVEITAPRIRGWVWRFRETATCGCRAMRLKQVETALTRAKLAFAASMSDANADVVVALTVQRDQLRTAR